MRLTLIGDGAEVLVVVCDEEEGDCRIGYEAGGEPVWFLTGEYGRVSVATLSGTGPGSGSLHSAILPRAITRSIIAVSGDLSSKIFGVIGLGARLGSFGAL